MGFRTAGAVPITEIDAFDLNYIVQKSPELMQSPHLFADAFNHSGSPDLVNAVNDSLFPGGVRQFSLDQVGEASSRREVQTEIDNIKEFVTKAESNTMNSEEEGDIQSPAKNGTNSIAMKKTVTLAQGETPSPKSGNEGQVYRRTPHLNAMDPSFHPPGMTPMPAGESDPSEPAFSNETNLTDGFEYKLPTVATIMKERRANIMEKVEATQPSAVSKLLCDENPATEFSAAALVDAIIVDAVEEASCTTKNPTEYIVC